MSVIDITKAVDQIRPSIVQINLLVSDLSIDIRRKIGKSFIPIILGTGFFVNSDGYVLTARHVIQGGYQIAEGIQAGRKLIRVGLAIPNIENIRHNFVLVDFDLINEDVRHDLALLRLKKNPFKGQVTSGFVIKGKELPLLHGVAPLNPNRPKDGAAVGISGYPLQETVLVTNAGWMATSWSSTIREVHMPGAPQWFRIPDIADIYLADVEVNPGNSGAPVYLISNNSVIGMCVASKPAPVRNQNNNNVVISGQKLYYSSGLTIVIPTLYIIELLKKHSLGWSRV